ncbi:hypothetical protein GS488_05775 [Rhodococcus hoagii]|nr:hypothetical protein [Prescottella equi]
MNDFDTLVQRYLDVWNETDARARTAVGAGRAGGRWSLDGPGGVAGQCDQFMEDSGINGIDGFSEIEQCPSDASGSASQSRRCVHTSVSVVVQQRVGGSGRGSGGGFPLCCIQFGENKFQVDARVPAPSRMRVTQPSAARTRSRLDAVEASTAAASANLRTSTSRVRARAVRARTISACRMRSSLEPPARAQRAGSAVTAASTWSSSSSMGARSTTVVGANWAAASTARRHCRTVSSRPRAASSRRRARPGAESTARRTSASVWPARAIPSRMLWARADLSVPVDGVVVRRARVRSVSGRRGRSRRGPAASSTMRTVRAPRSRDGTAVWGWRASSHATTSVVVPCSIRARTASRASSLVWGSE